MKLEDLRDQIDLLDANIVKLIAERAKVAGQIGKAKAKLGKSVEDRDREKRVLENVMDIAREEKLNAAEIEKIYQQIMKICKGVQGTCVAFQGEVGAYSEEALFQYFGSAVQSAPYATLEEVFKAVQCGEAQYGVVPVENSLEGSISRTYDLMVDTNLRIYGEIEFRVVHCLIGAPGALLDNVKRVYSHPQALGQCQTFLRQLGCEIISSYDTAGSVKSVKEAGSDTEAAIAGARSAEIYGMKILVRGIEDTVNNYTRFFILADHDSPPTGNDKTTVVFSVKHKPGALYDSLKELAVRKVNLTKIESRPRRQKPWEYNFYVDIEGHREDALCKEALQALESTAIFFKVLGSYPKAK